jgi:two-component system response regulator DevR
LSSALNRQPNESCSAVALGETNATVLEVNESVLILFVEYHNVFREAASVLMDQQEDLEVVSQASSVAEGRERMAQGGIDAAIVDIPLPPDEGAEDMVRDLHEANPSVPVLTLTAIEDSEVIDRFLKAGASEVLPKNMSFVEVLAAVRRLGGER